MKAFTLSGLSTLFAGLTLAHPVDLAKRGGRFSEIDITILQFALTLEHLENTFYREAFRSFQLQDFLNAGFDEEFFLNLEFIASDESAHVEFLIAAIESVGIQPVQPCQYNFPVTDVASFVTVSAILESVGTSAYLGAAPFVGSKDILSVAASIMATEALHTSSQRSSLGAIAATNPFATPLDANSVFTIASQFIVSCPPSNPPLPFTAFPGLKVNSQPCFDESGNGGSFSTESINYATVVSDIESATDTTSAYVTDVTDSATSVAYDTTSTTTADYTTTTTTDSTTAATTTDSAAAYTTSTTSTMDMSTTETTSTTMDMASTTTSMDMSMASTTMSMDMSMATAAPERRSTALKARTNGGAFSSCPAPGAGSSVQLIPDFSKSRHDFSRVEIIFVTFIAGLEVVSIQAVFESDGSINVSIPGSIGGGQVFIFITIVDISGRSLSDNEVLFGPAIMESEYYPTQVQKTLISDADFRAVAPSFPSISQ
ncbi:uncharacterized protein A1O5_09746 [Cladophialophora psammophila CBS 110553]|uniref:Ferritin-like diiron domain-containing protein n=1 Tax=Cladophialophora psammophila CBS 110553 TaxID=1182543 RepID=W9X9H6_9EURO|nr:uncharacterized protein A1O5_09746 [Cladophialophora psammophila CBS 110553]EXJ67099.1 hypothetical protein A1O5_09746 [Cladophialophora psammophila CBS 110553]